MPSGDRSITDPSSIEKKLLEYRAKKQREAYLSNTKEKINGFFENLTKRKPKPSDTVMPEPEPTPEELEELVPEEECDSETTENESTLFQCTYVDMAYYSLWFMLWLTLYIIFIKLQFGSVYFIVSALIAMYVNTRTGPRKRNEVSAYSVFNKDCESIPGTLKAEQFEREIRYGAGAVH